jgi:hypothetical protein
MIAHDVHTYVCARSVDMRDVQVCITPYTYHDVDRDVYNPSYEWEMREGSSPVTASDHPLKDEREYYSPFVVYDDPVQGKVSALQVLALYSAEPDWGMDEGLKLSPLQVVTAGSQGYRHLRYGWFFLKAGVAHRRALRFSELAEHAFSRGDSYWGLRFSARTLHYMQDLLTPYHLKPIPEWYWLPRIFRLKRVFKTICTQHMRFEGYTGYHLWHGSEGYIQCIENCRPQALSNFSRDLIKASRHVRRLFYSIFRECLLFWGEGELNVPTQLQGEWIEKHALSEKLNLHIHKWLHMLSTFVKGYIKMYVLPHVIGNAP